MNKIFNELPAELIQAANLLNNMVEKLSPANSGKMGQILITDVVVWAN